MVVFEYEQLDNSFKSYPVENQVIFFHSTAF